MVRGGTGVLFVHVWVQNGCLGGVGMGVLFLDIVEGLVWGWGDLGFEFWI